jgi:LPXTG-site transpeptidase (sortase) family protein
MNNSLKKIISLFLMLLGVGLIVAVLMPIASYLSLSKQKFPELLSPLYDYEHLAGEPDYTQASTWFINTNESAFKTKSVDYYTISIPALKIDNATVAIGGEDLKKNLIHFPQTALPGNRGNAVIFGHSVLPTFFNPKDYLTIFSTLPTLNKGDEILVDYDGIRYKYVVETMFEVTPTDIQILEQHPS